MAFVPLSRNVRHDTCVCGALGHDLAGWLARASPMVASILDDALSGVEITAADATVLLGTRGDDAHASLAAADELRRRSIGEDVTYVVNRNINFTNGMLRGLLS